MAKQSAVMKIAWQIARKIIAEQTFARLAIGHDAAIIAAHRVFGMGPKRAKVFDTEVKAAMSELAGLFVMDANENNDAALTYAKAKRNELILSIVGPELFVPFDQIYGDAYIDEAKRIRIRMKETGDGRAKS